MIAAAVSVDWGWIGGIVGCVLVALAVEFAIACLIGGMLGLNERTTPHLRARDADSDFDVEFIWPLDRRNG